MIIKDFFRIFANLPSGAKKKSVIFIFFLILTTILEIFGISLIVPILDLISNSKTDLNQRIISAAEYIGIEKIQDSLTYILFLFVGIYAFKNVILIFFYYWRNKFIWNLYQKLSLSLLTKYMQKSMLFYFEKNSSELINNTFQETRNYMNCYNEFLKLISELLILIGIIILLLFYDPASTLVVGISIGIFSILILLFTKKKISNLGQVRIDSSIGQLKLLQEIFGSIKDIKLKSLELNFFKLYQKVVKRYSKSSYVVNTIIELPKIFFELIFIFCICFLVYFFQSSELGKINIISHLGLYIVAAFRCLPSVYRVLASIQQINFLKPSLNKILPELNSLEKFDKNNNQVKKINFLKSIKIENITFKYPGKEKEVIKNFSLEINKNDFIGISGKSGKGKSTIVDLIMGLLEPSRGKVLIDDKDIKSNLQGWQKNLGFVSQNTFLLDNNIRNNIAFGISREEINNDLLYKSAEDAQILDFILSLKDKFETRVGERGISLSSGQMQRIGIARELYRNPSVLILDEATSALDLETEKEFLNCLENIKQNKTIIFISHRKSALKNCNKIIEIND